MLICLILNSPLVYMLRERSVYLLLSQEIHFPKMSHDSKKKKKMLKNLSPGQNTPLLLCVIMCRRRLLGLLKLAGQ